MNDKNISDEVKLEKCSRSKFLASLVTQFIKHGTINFKDNRSITSSTAETPQLKLKINTKASR